MTVEEWLGETNQLGIDIWYRKYRYGNETFDEWLDRVSGGNAAIRQLIIEKKFLFGGRILSNRGLSKYGIKTTLSNCFPRGTLVYTEDGYKQIERIKKGERVLTHNGRFKVVNEVMNRIYNGNLNIIEGYNFNQIICTSNHKFLTSNGWKEAKDLTKDDYIKYMNFNHQFVEYEEDLLSYIALKKNEVIDEKDDMIRLGYEFVGGNGAKTVKYGNYIKRHITVTKNLLYVIGRWLGDGSITNRKVSGNNSIFQIVFNEKELQELEYCKKILEDTFSIELKVTENEEQHTRILRAENVFLCEYFNRNFGKGGENKYISNHLVPYMEWVYGLLDADGLVLKQGGIRLCLKNEKLLTQVKECLRLNGIVSSEIKKIKNNMSFYIWRLDIPKNLCSKIVKNLHKHYDDDRMQVDYTEDTKFKIVDEAVYLRVSNNTSFHTDSIGQNIQVFNISVEDDNSYIVNDVVVHNCYVISPPEDNIESIFDCAKKLARTYSYGGGCGVDLSQLAPRGAKVNNTAKETSGAVSFTDLYSLVTGLIGQNGRRGALMLSLSCEHPDLEEFIGLKSNLDRVTKANISIRITDKFMAAVKNKKPFTLSFTRVETGETITKTVDAASIFHKICEMNWDYAEPGMLFWDRIDNWNLLSCDDNFHYAGTNPCFGGAMGLLTTDGYKTFEELEDTEPYIYNVNGNITKSKVWCSGEKDTVKVKTAKGEIVCTPDHRFMTVDGNECMAKDLKGKYLMPCTNANKVFDPLYVKLGFIQGDGQLNRLNSNEHYGIEVNIGQKDKDIYDLFADDSYTIESPGRTIYVNGYKDKLLELGFSKNNLPDREFPKTYESWNKLQKASFLHGCYSANGSVIKNGRIAYKTTCRKFAEQLSETLFNDFGIEGVYITTNKPHKVIFPNGEYECRESYDVNIGRYKEITKFIAEINFYQQYKREQLAQMLKNRPTLVYAVIPNGIQKVYDFKESERHWGIVEGYVVHNCAEEPLPAGGSCLLGSINLAEFVCPDETFDFEAFRRTVSKSVIALNQVLDEGLPLHPLQKQQDSVRDWRQIGLGIMGLADMLIKMGIRYGSYDSIRICDLIGREMAREAIFTSASLASVYGAYPKYDASAISKSPYLSTHISWKDEPAVLDEIIAGGLRNSQLLTIAPTGTLSSMLGISGGIEPIYANYYTRKTESLHGHDEYYKAYTPIVKKYMGEHGLKDDSQLPDFFVTAQTLNYRERIDMQAIWQKHIDASISSTVNVPNSFTVEDTEDLYMYAWEKGLKGVTIFRDGCKRSGILTVDKKKTKTNNTDTDTQVLERGIIIKADDNCIGRKRTLHTGCGTLHCEAFFDPDTGDLLETYFSKGSQGGCNNFMIGLSRMISLAARGGVDIYSIVDQLKSSGTCPSYAVRTATQHDTSKGSCCPVAIGNALLDMYKEIQDDIGCSDSSDSDSDTVPKSNTKQPVPKIKAKVSNTAKCPQCGGTLVFEGGCNTCKECGWSKCD